MRDVGSTELKTKAYVLRRTNYGESDRILNFITPSGKISAIAKGSRREKSKLAGGIEMLSLIDVNIHVGHSDMGVLTSAKMIKYYGNIVKSLDALELSSMMLKKISKAADSSDSPDYFNILSQSLEGLNSGNNLELVETWFLFNYLKAIGEQVNLYHDIKGEKLKPDRLYEWDTLERSLAPCSDSGRPEALHATEYSSQSFLESQTLFLNAPLVGANEIKLMRLILSTNLGVVSKVRGVERMLPVALKIARSFEG